MCQQHQHRMVSSFSAVASLSLLCWILQLTLSEGLVPSSMLMKGGLSIRQQQTQQQQQHHHHHIRQNQRQKNTNYQQLSSLIMSKITSDDETVVSTADSSSSPGGDNNNNSIFSESIQQEARDALEGVGWARPTLIDDGELTSDDPFVQQIDASIRKDYGFGLDDLLNPAKVVNLERELYNLRVELSSLTGVEPTVDLDDSNYDGGGGGPDADAIRAKITKKSNDLAIERRSVFRGWLKNIFIGQAVISFGISYVMATNPSVLFGGYDWYYSYNMDISIQVLGYWFWWLFIVPSLRSRRPKGAEKKALDIAFLGTPLVSILAPVATKDTGLIWIANFAVVAASYGFAFLTEGNDDSDDDSASDDESKKQQPAWLKFVYKSLDFGSGRERGARN